MHVPLNTEKLMPIVFLMSEQKVHAQNVCVGKSNVVTYFVIWVLLCRLQSIAALRDHFVRRLFFVSRNTNVSVWQFLL